MERAIICVEMFNLKTLRGIDGGAAEMVDAATGAEVLDVTSAEA